MKNYQYIIVGAGIFGATLAERLAHRKNSVLVIDKRSHVAGNIYSFTDADTGIEIHKYGSHIFHTELNHVWNYITQFSEFNAYIHKVDTRHENKLYPMPINLDTINLLYGTNMNAVEAKKFVEEEARKTGITNPQNFEEKGLSLVGEKIYTSFLKGYTTKQWGTDPKNLSAEILNRIPIRFSHNNQYFMTAQHQGIPKNGYTRLVENMLSSDMIDVKLNMHFENMYASIPKSTIVIYCGQIDALLDYQLGVLPYRSLRFETTKTKKSLGQAVINEADINVAYTRTHDYKYYQIHKPEIIEQEMSIICHEYPADYEKGSEAYYPVDNPRSRQLYQKYTELAREKYPNLILGGRLGAYKYWDMDIAIDNALKLANNIV